MVGFQQEVFFLNRFYSYRRVDQLFLVRGKLNELFNMICKGRLHIQLYRY